jgi:hypothetical protein
MPAAAFHDDDSDAAPRQMLGEKQSGHAGADDTYVGAASRIRFSRSEV